ncbi:unnamed protein product, partial [Mesorhabditis spiculigera]
MWLAISLLGCVAFGAGVEAQMQCKDMNNNNVEWYVFYKLPKIAKSNNPLIANGTGMLYMDKNTRTWTYNATISIMDANQAVAYTLQQYYDQRDNPLMLSIFYNDEKPDNTTSFDLGHQKGVTAFDMFSGFWLIHSAPKFPPADHYFYPPNAHSFGQMGICISLATHNIQNVADQLYYTQPFIYQFDLPAQFANLYPRLADVKKGLYPKAAPFSSIKPFTALGGTQFTHFAKAKGFANDLYGALIAPTINTDLYVESWQHQPGNLGPWCNYTQKVLDITWVNLPFNFTFETWWDHSKYAIATNQGPSNVTPPPLVCIGDINRQEHQMVRGGGSMCLNDAQLYAAFRSIPSTSDKCALGMKDDKDEMLDTNHKMSEPAQKPAPTKKKAKKKPVKGVNIEAQRRMTFLHEAAGHISIQGTSSNDAYAKLSRKYGKLLRQVKQHGTYQLPKGYNRAYCRKCWEVFAGKEKFGLNENAGCLVRTCGNCQATRRYQKSEKHQTRNDEEFKGSILATYQTTNAGSTNSNKA